MLGTVSPSQLIKLFRRWINLTLGGRGTLNDLSVCVFVLPYTLKLFIKDSFELISNCIKLMPELTTYNSFINSEDNDISQSSHIWMSASLRRIRWVSHQLALQDCSDCQSCWKYRRNRNFSRWDGSLLHTGMQHWICRRSIYWLVATLCRS